RGFAATSMDDLVRGTGVSRHGIYAAFDGKQGLFLACLEAYGDAVVSPAFAQVEADGAQLEAVRQYFRHQIDRAAETGFPGIGCLIANTMTETGPHEPEVLAKVRAHNERLKRGFANVLRTEAQHAGSALDPGTVDDLAGFLATATQGLWSLSRSVDGPEPLHAFAGTLIDLIRRRITP
ncbi:MAG: TetR/AcrR family transcriptional regulator, partial [Pseudomonadota bacterium]